MWGLSVLTRGDHESLVRLHQRIQEKRMHKRNQHPTGVWETNHRCPNVVPVQVCISAHYFTCLALWRNEPDLPLESGHSFGLPEPKWKDKWRKHKIPGIKPSHRFLERDVLWLVLFPFLLGLYHWISQGPSWRLPWEIAELPVNLHLSIGIGTLSVLFMIIWHSKIHVPGNLFTKLL